MVTSRNNHKDEHRQEAKRENARWLIEECHEHPDLVAKRLGVSRDVLDKLLLRGT